jgi:hypothetical protein
MRLITALGSLSVLLIAPHVEPGLLTAPRTGRGVFGQLVVPHCEPFGDQDARRSRGLCGAVSLCCQRDTRF